MLRFNPIEGTIELAPTSSPRQGPRGLRGTPGDPGEPGAPGRDGKDGLDGRNGADGRNGVDGKDGRDGRDGVANTIRHGLQPPDSSSGNPGDFFIQLPVLLFYGPMRPDRSWPEGIPLQGAPGAPGRDGEPGKDGKDGRPGRDGKDGLPGPRGERGFTSQPARTLDPSQPRPSITVAVN